MAYLKNLLYCKVWTFGPTVCIVGLVIYVCIYLELNGHSNKIRVDFTLNNDRNNSVTRATPEKFQSNHNKSDCFQSPYVICKKYRDLENAFSSASATFPVGNATPPVVLVNLIRESIHNVYNNCPLPCVLKPPDKIQEATGVIVQGRSVTDKHFPPIRNDNQIYLLQALESPIHYRGTILHADSKFKDQINLVSTYRVDSDIQRFYSHLCLNDRPKKTRKDFKKMYDKKSRSVAWFVSNCKTQSKRMPYVRELRKYIDVDIYGKCGTNSYSKFGSESRFLTDTYKFYLSFENSFCQDYVTEKFFKLFEEDVFVVSVVRGGMDYEKYFPPKTFINAGNFQTPRELAGYLKKVGNDFEKYIVYLEERDKYTKEPYMHKHMTWMCSVCTAFHNIVKGVTSRYEYKNIGSWLSKDICHVPPDVAKVSKPLFQRILGYIKGGAI